MHHRFAWLAAIVWLGWIFKPLNPIKLITLAIGIAPLRDSFT
jgi:hypothetical protein